MSTTDPPADWRDAVEGERAKKERFFRDGPRSPLPPELTGEDFPGLDYYDPDPSYRYELDLYEHDDVEEVTVGTSAEGERTYLRWGEFRFEVDGEAVTLQAYRPADGSDRLWVPFRDETSGEETYGAGRYLDLEPDHHRVGGRWVLDFNRAYNPTCAYNPAYECPLVPMENWLDVRIEAGERDFPGHDVAE
ncbi:hypothetical protein C2R22_18480 [Salinigranum rubrum]|uniref:DUF1684 domain-containing protein n=1 Tax=Salinigranum rubrum TaxID=755307 RepID=A0A2I8VNB4_9EURY|nr:DUF1684 domain-containing protein [Salinigranum rubrum]AUV83385.1 hypothetical protein C2R22_18480 [Salinigranum rubrum]